METGQAPGAFGVGDAERHLQETLADDVAGDVGCYGLTSRQFAEAVFGGDFPSGRRADNDVVGLIGYRIVRRSRQAPAVRDPSKKCMGVQQCPLHYLHPHAVSSSSSSGSRKLSGMMTFSLRTSGCRFLRGLHPTSRATSSPRRTFLRRMRDMHRRNPLRHGTPLHHHRTAGGCWGKCGERRKHGHVQLLSRWDIQLSGRNQRSPQRACRRQDGVQPGTGRRWKAHGRARRCRA